MVIDIHLCPSRVGSVGSVADLGGCTSGLGWVYLGTCMAYLNLGGCTLGHLLGWSIFAPKTSFFYSKRRFLSILAQKTTKSGFRLHFSQKKTWIFRTLRGLFSLEAQRLDQLTGHTRRPRWSSDPLLPEPGLARTGLLQAQTGRRRGPQTRTTGKDVLSTNR